MSARLFRGSVDYLLLFLGKEANSVRRDREWQKWPVTIVTGAYIGFVVGKTLGGLLFKGAKIKFD